MGIEINQGNKVAALEWLAATDREPESALPPLDHVTPWQWPEPIGVHADGVRIAAAMFAPFRAAFPDLRRDAHIPLGGQSSAHEDGQVDGKWWIAGTGGYSGRARNRGFGIPATGQDPRIRRGEFLCFDDQGNVTHARTIWDFVTWSDEIGLSVLPPQRGAQHVHPAPKAFDAARAGPQSARASDMPRQLGGAQISGGLDTFDESDLSSMGMARYFHPGIKWYGPAGIGARLSLCALETSHRRPWLAVFADRLVRYLESLFAEGPMPAASGPTGVIATLTGPDPGHSASGARIEVPGLDFRLRTHGQVTKNRVIVDMIRLFRQMGGDPFAHVAGQAA